MILDRVRCRPLQGSRKISLDRIGALESRLFGMNVFKLVQINFYDIQLEAAASPVRGGFKFVAVRMLAEVCDPFNTRDLVLRKQI